MIVATSWFLITLAGLGLPFALAFVGRRSWRDHDFVTLAALALVSGLLVDHALGLATGSLALQNAAAWAGVLFGAGGIALFWHARRHLPASATGSRLYWAPVLAAALIALLAVTIYAMPLLEWDARSIWFFHGKAIFFDGGLKVSPFWNNPAYDWSHKDYPNLIPMLAARAAAFAGAWNEYAPKGALVPVAAGGLLALLALIRAMRFAFLAPAIAAVLGPSLWNGNMDGWLALYGAVAALGLAAWEETGRRAPLALAAMSLGVALCLKNEGQLLVLAILPALAWAAMTRRRDLSWTDLSLLAAAVPFALWLTVKAGLGVHGDMEGAGLVRRSLEVAANLPELTYRLSFLAENALEGTHLFAALAAYLAAGACVGFRRSGLLCGLSATLYVCGLVMVYLGTPQDFVWHVHTSLDRVVMMPTLLFLSGLSTMIPDILPAWRQAAPPPVS